MTVPTVYYRFYMCQSSVGGKVLATQYGIYLVLNFRYKRQKTLNFFFLKCSVYFTICKSCHNFA